MEKKTLAEKRPDLIQDWDYSKNDFTPYDVTFGCSRKAHWKCHKCGHEWVTSINSRTNLGIGRGCRICGELLRRESFRETIRTRKPKETINREIARYFSNIGDKVLLKCPDCEYEWMVYLEDKEYSCPRCDN